ncbi:sporulation/spore germination protein [Anabaena lutea]|uniref:Sporulation/spore germination protein n=1 Tax=Anabaena lutea FACHB-196 TaxID=2692881 RepID=A0ABR8FH59_9NOST|nr:sporulation/spore germination protein [Anabaena lutea]MBD2568060.1 sporulation/spore germination protein [Anabaena lutea FACHB-196]
MNSKKKYLLSLILLAFCTSISSCATNDTANNSQSQTSTPITTPNNAVSPIPQLTPSTSPPSKVVPYSTTESPSEELPSPNSKAVSGKTTNVTLYTSDEQCQELIPKTASVSANESMTEAIGKIIEQRDTTDFSLSGYRVNVKNGVATVDLRISPDSKRQIASLSSCEQFALFGSLRKTLTSNSQWKIKDVRFTERDKEIVL